MNFVLPKEPCRELDSWHATCSPTIRNAFELEEITSCFVNISLANSVSYHFLKSFLHNEKMEVNILSRP